MRLVLIATCLLTLAACSQEESQSSAASNVPIGSGFDHYVLSLSWSPGYCRSEGDRANQEQCGTSDPFGFVVHGLWPQFDDGYPEFCETNQPLRVPRSLADSLSDIMPSRGLVFHQWRKHGTCSGLSQQDYFDVTRSAFEYITIPESFENRDSTVTMDHMDVEAAFRDANPAIEADAIAVTCDRRFLRDVRICMTKSLDGFVSCPEVDRRDCRLDGVVVPPN